MKRVLIPLAVILVVANVVCSTATPAPLYPSYRPFRRLPSATPTSDAKAVQDAIATVRHSDDMARDAEPYAREVDWYAEQRDDQWWVIGLFESPWGVQFVRDAAIWEGRVYAHINRGARPTHEWVISRARERWNLTTYYTRLTPEAAIDKVQVSEPVRDALKGVQVVDSSAGLIEDNAVTQQWRFAFYVEWPGGSKAVVVVGGLGADGAEEGNYMDGYGFGNATETYWKIPLNFVDWVRDVANRRGWTEATNVK